jgi:hypothetical protein
MIPLIQNPAFYTSTDVVYPPFKNGFYMEEYFLNYMIQTNQIYDKDGRMYIPALWTNFQLADWFRSNYMKMQYDLIQFIQSYPCDKGYFTVIQHDDASFLQLPPNTKIYGACNGHIPLPLIYEDNNHTLLNKHGEIITFSDRKILCSFVGCKTHNVRNNCVDALLNIDGFDIVIPESGWTLNVKKSHQDIFIEKTLQSKFALAPRGYGKSSFRFFEIMQLGCIPVYVWDDVEWLPYKDIIDYSSFCISIHISKITELKTILINIDETRYVEMQQNYNKIKHMFGLEYMCKYIVGKV